MSELKELKESVDTLVTHVSTQNGLLEELPAIIFKVNILWKVFGYVCAAILLGVIGLIAKAMLGGS